MKRLLKLEAWQVFVFLILPAIFASNDLLWLSVIWSIVFFSAVLYLGLQLHKAALPYYKANKTKFIVNTVFMAAYLAAIAILFNFFTNVTNNFQQHGWVLLALFAGHVYFAYCLIYLAIFFAKLLTALEFGRVEKFDSYAGNFFLIIFLVVGVWWIYPKITRFLAKENLA